MDRLTERIATAQRAISTLEELSRKSDRTTVERDPMLQRFEYSVEATWKAAQRFLSAIEGLEIGAPKAAVRASLRTGLLDEAQTRAGLAMVEDRNLTVHTYDERLAEEIAARVPVHTALLRIWIEAIAVRSSDRSG